VFPPANVTDPESPSLSKWRRSIAKEVRTIGEGRSMREPGTIGKGDRDTISPPIRQRGCNPRVLFRTNDHSENRRGVLARNARERSTEATTRQLVDSLGSDARCDHRGAYRTCTLPGSEILSNADSSNGGYCKIVTRAAIDS
jgi:hypothetical protein